MLTLIGQHSSPLRAFLYGLHLHLSKPQWQPVLRLADALVVSAARPKTMASLYRLIVEAPAPSHGADTLRLSPWPAADLRTPRRPLSMAALAAYAHQTNQWTLEVSLEDS